MKINFTVINHNARIEMNLSWLEYGLVDLIYNLANHPQNKYDGWCYASKAALAKNLDISERAVYKIMNRMVMLGLLERHPITKHLKITVNWYEKVVISPESGHTEQSAVPLNEVHTPPEQSAVSTPERSSYNIYNKDNDINKQHTSASSDASDTSFEQLWNNYPKKLGKKQAFKAYKRDGLKESDLVARALENYKAELKRAGTQEQYIQHGGTWFNNWRDWTESRGEKPSEPPKTVSQAKEDKIARIKAFKCVNCKGGTIHLVDEDYGCNQCGSRYNEYFKTELKVA